MPYSSKARFIHSRVESPRRFDKRSMRVKKIGTHGTKIVVGCPKGHWHPKGRKGGKCDVGMQVQSVLRPKVK